MSKIGIKLNRDLFDKVSSGAKTVTTRKGHKDYKLGENYFYDPIGEDCRIDIKVTEVRKILFGQIVIDDIKFLYLDEGYTCKEDFMSVIFGIYGFIDLDDPMTVIYFELV